MLGYIVRRLLQAIPLLFVVSLMAFLLIRLGGDPMSMYGFSPTMTPEDRERIIARHGWDRPLLVQYGYWLRDAVTGDWGTSLYTYEPVTGMIVARLDNTLLLMGTTFVVTLAVAIPLGIASALRQNSAFDHLVTGASFFGYAMPTFWLGLVCIMLFSVKFHQWGLPTLPAGGMYSLTDGPSLPGLIRHMVMPVFVLSIVSVAPYIRYIRASVLEVLRQDYVRTARAKGLDERWVIGRHAFKNALLPLVTLIALNIPRIFSGALITEQVFAWPGMGRLFVDHAARVDYPVLMGLVLTVAVLVIAFNLLADLAYAWLDPRIRLG
jgi:peptide/nickel transport system permease protein